MCRGGGGWLLVRPWGGADVCEAGVRALAAGACVREGLRVFLCLHFDLNSRPLLILCASFAHPLLILSLLAQLSAAPSSDANLTLQHQAGRRQKATTLCSLSSTARKATTARAGAVLTNIRARRLNSTIAVSSVASLLASLARRATRAPGLIHKSCCLIHIRCLVHARTHQHSNTRMLMHAPTQIVGRVLHSLCVPLRPTMAN